MKKKLLLLFMIVSVTVGISGCGSSVKQLEKTWEVGAAFDVETAFQCSEGTKITVKDGNLDTSKVGSVTENFIVTKGGEEKEESYTFHIVDTQAPVFDVKAVTVYTGSEFRAEDYAVCSDNSGEKPTISVIENTVDPISAGMYIVTYEATDASGNTTVQDVNVEVLSLETQEEVADYVDQYLNKNGYEGFEVVKNTLGAVFVRGEEFEVEINEDGRTLSVYPDIYILEDLFAGKYTISGIIFRYKHSDRRDIYERYVPQAHTMTIKNELSSISIVEDGIPDSLNSEFEARYYLSTFKYSLSHENLEQMWNILEEKPVTVELLTKEITFNTSTWEYDETELPVMTYEISEENMVQLETMKMIYEELLEVFGKYGEE